MNSQILGKVAGLVDQVNYFWQGFNLRMDPFAILDIFLVALILYWGYLLLKETRAMRILYGIALLAIVFLLGRVFQLATLNFILKYLITMILVAIPIVFQPELRNFLERVGRAQIMGDFSTLKRKEILYIVKEIIKAVDILSKNKIGALLVITQRTGLREFVETGTKIDGSVSADLLLSIFAPNTPLHDGAVIISGGKVVAASCILPLSEDKFDFSIGTRHKAAIGLSQQSDAIVIVVSEQRGSISLAYDRMLDKDISTEKLEEKIQEILHEKRVTEKKTITEGKKDV